MSRIALLIPGLDRIGGAEQQVLLLANGLRQRGWRVSVVALSGRGGDAAQGLAANGIEFHSLGMRKGLADPRGWVRFQLWLRAQRPDIVHAHLAHAAWMARWSRLLAPVPILVDTLHSSSTGTVGRRLGYRWSGWLPDRVTAVSEAVAEAHRAAGMVRAEKLAVLPNGVDVEQWKPDAARREAMRRTLGLENEFLWLAAGRLEAVKDYPTLLRAVASVPDSSRLVIAGAGPLQAGLARLASALGIAERVRFLGFEPHLLPWMQAADGFVLSSLWEGLPMGLLEAGACALPGVATDVPGTREAVINGITGYLAEPGNSEALAAAMTAMMRSPAEIRLAMGLRSRAHIASEFSLGAVLNRWEALFAELMEKSGSRSALGLSVVRH